MQEELNPGPELFSLSDVFPFWTGRRAKFIEAPLRHGIEIAKRQFAGTRLFVYSAITEFDYDGMSQRMGDVIGVANVADGPAIGNQLLDTTKSAMLAKNETWKLMSEDVLPRNVLPATGTVVSGDPHPHHIAGIKIGDKEMYESAYIRIYSISCDGDADPLTNLLSKLATRSDMSLQDDFISYLQWIGKSA